MEFTKRSARSASKDSRKESIVFPSLFRTVLLPLVSLCPYFHLSPDMSFKTSWGEESREKTDGR